VHLETCKFAAVALSASLCGYGKTGSERWCDLLWTDGAVSRERLLRVQPFQRINHFPGMLEICRKVPLARVMRRMSAVLPDAFSYHPRTWLLPDEAPLFLQALQRARARATGLPSPPGEPAGAQQRFLQARDVYLCSAAAAGPREDRRETLDGVLSDAGRRERSRRRREGWQGPGGSGGPGGPPPPAPRGRDAAPPTYILKPSSGAMGRNIHLVQLPEQVPGDPAVLDGAVAQEYLERPLLLGGRKFDCRVYVLVRSVWPLEVHVYREGLARLASVPYRAPDAGNLSDQTMHLTNYSINKRGAGDGAETDDPDTGCKRLLSDALRQVAAEQAAAREAAGGGAGDGGEGAPRGEGGEAPRGARRRRPRGGVTEESLWESIEELAVKTLLSVHPHLAHAYCCAVPAASAPPGPNPAVEAEGAGPAGSLEAAIEATLRKTHGIGSRKTHGKSARPSGRPEDSLCFELLGFDVMFDERLKPWLVEINHSPSFGADTPLDLAVKTSVLSAAIAMLGQESGRRLGHLRGLRDQRSRRLYGPGGATGGADGCLLASGRHAGTLADLDRMLGAYSGEGGGGGGGGGTGSPSAGEEPPPTTTPPAPTPPTLGAAEGPGGGGGAGALSARPASRARAPGTGALARLAVEGHSAGVKVRGAASQFDSAPFLREVGRAAPAPSPGPPSRSARQVLEAEARGSLRFARAYPPRDRDGRRAALYHRVLGLAQTMWFQRRGGGGGYGCPCQACAEARGDHARRELAQGAGREAPGSRGGEGAAAEEVGGGAPGGRDAGAAGGLPPVRGTQGAGAPGKGRGRRGGSRAGSATTVEVEAEGSGSEGKGPGGGEARLPPARRGSGPGPGEGSDGLPAAPSAAGRQLPVR